MNSPLNGCGVILAGGQSSRMGTNKALLDFQGEPLIARLARKLQSWFPHVILITNTPETYRFLGLPMHGDRVPGLGPLGGLEAGLAASPFEHAFFCACDMPFVNEALVRHLMSLAPGHDIVVPQIGPSFEPMHAVYSRRCLPAITANLEAGRLRLLGIFESCRVRVVPEREIQPFGDPQHLFFNCNEPADLVKARAIADPTGGAGPGSKE